MGVTVSVVLADWVALLEQWRVNPAALESDDFYDNDVDDGWPDRFQANHREAAAWADSWRCLAEADDRYDELRRDLNGSDQSLWDQFISALFQRNRRPVAFDLPNFEPRWGRIFSALSPTSVDRLASVIDRADVERLRPAFEARCRSHLGSWLKNFDEFREYIGQWAVAVEAARSSGKALVVWISV